MRAYDNGSYFTVSYSADDARAFRSEWPVSSVRGKGAWEFSKSGDLVGAEGSASEGDGSDWLAFSQDCEAYGRAALAKRRPAKKTMKNPTKKTSRASHTVRVKITLLDDARSVVDSWVVSIADPASDHNALVQARMKARNDERYAPGDTVEAALVQRWTARKAMKNPVNPGRKKIRAIDREQFIATQKGIDRAFGLARERRLTVAQMNDRPTRAALWNEAYAQVGYGRFGSREGLWRAGDKSMDRAEQRVRKYFAKRKVAAARALAARKKKARGGLAKGR